MPSFHDRQQPPRPKFIYRERSVDSLRARAERTNNKWDSIYKGGYEAWKPKQGDNLIRFLPPTWPNAEHYGYDIWVHGYVGPEQGSYLCLFKMQNKSCPICAIAQKAQLAGDEEEYKKNAVQPRVLTWILDRDGDEPNKPLLYQISRTQDTSILSLCEDRRNHSVIWIDNHDEGYDVAFQRMGSGLATRYIGYQIAREPSPLSRDLRVQNGILDYIEQHPLPEVLQFYPAEYLQKAMLGMSGLPADDGAGRDLLQRPRTRRADPYEEEATTVESAEEDYDEDGVYAEPEEEEEPAPQPPRRPTPRATLRR